MLQSLVDRHLLEADCRIVDFDDIMSKFRTRQLHAATNKVRRALMRLDAWLIRRAERRIMDSWHGVSVCTDDDAAALRSASPAAFVAKVVNVVDRSRLPPRPADGHFRILFAGNLAFSANTDGLRVFVEEGWPALVEAVPTARLAIVGLNPSQEIFELAEQKGFDLHPNVPSLRPYYENCDVVIAPILFGSGTRIKILEAMAYGRPVVSTSMGAEGLGLDDGTHLLLADTMIEFAKALTDLARASARRSVLADEARRHQQLHYGPGASRKAVADLLRGGLDKANAERIPSR
jgi:glycosyltransferase involved in cell wall biosynthesis